MAQRFKRKMQPVKTVEPDKEDGLEVVWKNDRRIAENPANDGTAVQGSATPDEQCRAARR